jgi:arylsulfatase A-like enzyme
MKISRIAPLKSLLVGTLALPFVQCNTTEKEEPEKPNFVFILIDDMGWKDLSCYGSEFYETPNIDQLAEEGMRFTDAYAAASVSSPTRASLLTGKTPARLNLTDWIGPDQWHPDGKLGNAQFRDHLPLEEVTLAEQLKKSGYSTFFTGKWHLGEEGHHPEDQGFDINIAGNAAGAPPSYFYPYQRDSWEGTSWPGVIEDLKDGEKGEYLTDRLTQESLHFLDTAHQEPFFMLLSHYAVHRPLQAKNNIIDHYRNKVDTMQWEVDSTFVYRENVIERQKQNNPVFAAMIKSVDESVGRILNKLKSLDIDENTIVFFTSDNGGMSIMLKDWVEREQIATCNKPLRNGKGWLYEGGIRVPMIVKWPGVTEPGSVSSEPVVTMDFYPTILEMSGTEKVPRQHKDGKSIVPLLQGKDNLDRDAIYWHFPHYHASGHKPASAIRMGKYKLIRWYEEKPLELYNLEKDRAEQTNLADEMPEKAKQMKRALDKRLWEANARYPVRYRK